MHQWTRVDPGMYAGHTQGGDALTQCEHGSNRPCGVRESHHGAVTEHFYDHSIMNRSNLLHEPGILILSGGDARRTTIGGGEDGVLEPEDLPTLGSVLDITPTILALARLPVGEDMDGTVLVDVVREGLFEEAPTATVASHDTREWLENRPQQMLSTEAEEERLEQLRALGYLE